jgi:hypothetical protein
MTSSDAFSLFPFSTAPTDKRGLLGDWDFAAGARS